MLKINWITHIQLYDNLIEGKFIDAAKFDCLLEEITTFASENDLNDLIVDGKVEILFKNPKICEIFEMIGFNQMKIKNISDKFINLAIKKTRNKFTFDNKYKNEKGEFYKFYKNMILTTCFGSKDKCYECYIASKNGHLECLKYLHENGYYWDSWISTIAAENGHLECLKYAHENNCPWNINTCMNAAYNGHLECLKYAHENGCPWNEYTCLNAAGNGHLECLKYAHENNCPWDLYTCINAVYDGYLDCLQYAHENGCPWNCDTCSCAAQNGHLKCLKYAHENGCFWNSDTCTYAAQNGHLECLKYAYENGCPWNEFMRVKNELKYDSKCLKYFAELLQNYAHENNYFDRFYNIKSVVIQYNDE
ncbi:ankyrin repeat domain-containing protein [Bodo saltans virus]|uniref:Ankyrin repeat domain-containing protein n=1 Tax=Bodo saltans virus TaxID=2024608 RepID=A0A2H4UWK7_9VIRU|nr:ankyrin repeat domain-containing protein [Bodo saltans virus]ATZ81199.1 ankyrin repeat domain-containing protein [Bodo saltans virus]